MVEVILKIELHKTDSDEELLFTSGLDGSA